VIARVVISTPSVIAAWTDDSVAFRSQEEGCRFAEVFAEFYLQVLKEPGLLHFNVAVNEEKTYYIIYEEFVEVELTRLTDIC